MFVDQRVCKDDWVSPAELWIMNLNHPIKRTARMKTWHTACFPDEASKAFGWV